MMAAPLDLLVAVARTLMAPAPPQVPLPVKGVVCHPPVQADTPYVLLSQETARVAFPRTVITFFLTVVSAYQGPQEVADVAAHVHTLLALPLGVQGGVLALRQGDQTLTFDPQGTTCLTLHYTGLYHAHEHLRFNP